MTVTVYQWLTKATAGLTRRGVGTGRLDCLVFLEDVTGKDRAWLLAHPEFELSRQQVERLKIVLKRRAAHEPLAYIRGRTEFYGREFVLNSNVLDPRPESETMIDLFKKIVQNGSFWPLSHTRQTRKLCIADVGTGSGALGITAKLELPDSAIELLDIDKRALAVAKMNVDLFTLEMRVTHSDLLSNAREKQDILLCNLPYVPDDFQINPAAMREPKIAIFGGPDGLNLYRKLFKQVQKRAEKPLYILTEALPPQHELLAGIAADHGYTLLESENFIQVFEHGA